MRWFIYYLLKLIFGVLGIAFYLAPLAILIYYETPVLCMVLCSVSIFFGITFCFLGMAVTKPKIEDKYK